MSLSQIALTGDARLFFMHIPKTAGTTLIQIVEQHFNEDEIARWLYPFELIEKPAQFFNEHRYFHGHVEYGLMCSFLPKRPVAMTMLREPVERYLSQFGNEKRVPLAQIPDTTAEVLSEFQRISLDRFVCDPPEMLSARSKNYQNKQSRMLAFEYTDAHRVPSVETSLFSRNRTYVLPTPTLEQARQRLNHFSFFGLTERFQDSLFLMAYTFGWLPVVDYRTVGVAPAGQRPYQRDVPTDVLKKIHDSNLIDKQLYAYAQQLFQARYDQMCQETLERYGQREHARLKLPLPIEVIAELLDHNYRQRFVERNPALPVLKLEFDQKISGLNWGISERDPLHGPFRWSGPGRCSTLDLPLSAASDVCLRFSVPMAITGALLSSLVVTVNKAPISIEQHRVESGATICEGNVSKEILARRPGCTRVTFELTKTVTPLETMPGSNDDRLVGIALNWVEVKPVPKSGKP